MSDAAAPTTATGAPATAHPATGPESPAAPPSAVETANSPAANSPAADSPAANSPAANSRVADIVAGPGGVMTDEVGVVTGDLTLRSDLAAGQVTLHVQYKDADEWYVVTGGRVPLKDPGDLDAVHTLAVALLHRPEG